MKIGKFLYIFTFFIVACFGNLLMFSYNVDAMLGLKTLGYFVLAEFLLFLYFNTKINGKFLNFASVFVIVLFIFNFGQLMLYTFFRNVYPHIRFLLLLSSDNAFNGFKIIGLAFDAILLGILISCSNSDSETVLQKDFDINAQYDWEKVAKSVIVLTFPVKLALDLYALFVSVAQGGAEAREWVNTFPNVFLYYGKISLVGFALLLVVYKTKPQTQKRLFWFVEIYILIMMTSGIRSENVGYMLVMMFIYFASRRDKIHIPSVVLYGFLGYLVLTFVVVAGQFRSIETKNITTLMEYFSKAFTEKNVILFLFDQLGDTGYTAQCVINKWLPNLPTFNGMSYVWGWFAVIPNIPGITNLPGQMTKRSSFPLYLQEYGTLNGNYINIGGSLIGELFFNFNILGGIVAALFIGLLIGKISRKSALHFKMQNYYGLVKYIPIMFTCIYWIRDYFGGGIREAVWGPLMCLFVMGACKRKVKNDVSDNQSL